MNRSNRSRIGKSLVFDKRLNLVRKIERYVTQCFYQSLFVFSLYVLSFFHHTFFFSRFLFSINFYRRFKLACNYICYFTICFYVWSSHIQLRLFILHILFNWLNIDNVDFENHQVFVLQFGYYYIILSTYNGAKFMIRNYVENVPI